MPLLRTPRTVGNLGSSLVEKGTALVSHAKFSKFYTDEDFINTATHERNRFSVFYLSELTAR